MNPADRAAATATMLAVVLALSLCSAVAGAGTSGTCALPVAQAGYPCEEHQVTTKDGYILSVQRIPRGRAGGGGGGARAGQPVLLQHGVLTDGMCWVLGSPEESLAFILADRGFDVWIANNRGTRWSSRHVSLNTFNPMYWNWSWDEISAVDLPATVDYITTKNGQKPHYIGHSMGTLVMLAALSEGRMADKVKSAALLTPVAYLSQMGPLGGMVARAFGGLGWPPQQRRLLQVGPFGGLPMSEFNPTSPAVMRMMKRFCSSLPGMNCYDIVSGVTGRNYCLKGSGVMLPQPTSSKTMMHLAQTAGEGVLTKYDYVLPFTNKANYGQIRPPAYDLRKIPASFPLFLRYGGQDYLADPADVRHLLRDLQGHDPSKLTVQYIEQFAHLDFVVGVCAKDYVYKDLLAFLNRFN